MHCPSFDHEEVYFLRSSTSNAWDLLPEGHGLIDSLNHQSGLEASAQLHRVHESSMRWWGDGSVTSITSFLLEFDSGVANTGKLKWSTFRQKLTFEGIRLFVIEWSKHVDLSTRSKDRSISTCRLCWYIDKIEEFRLVDFLCRMVDTIRLVDFLWRDEQLVSIIRWV
jgi:hypothetical protein